MKNFPRIYVVAARAATIGMFREEKKAYLGNLAPTTDEESVLHFCYNRCGSRYISTVIQKLLSHRDIQHVDYAGYFTHTNQARLEELSDPKAIKKLVLPAGFHYGPFYWFLEGLPESEKRKTILTLRDPRDVLTSRFYSQAYAHTIFKQSAVDRRQRVREMGIDSFVLKECDEIIARYSRYQQKLLNRENVLWLPYEEMVLNFDSWLQKLSKFLEVPSDHPSVLEVKAAATFQVKKEDKFSHRRSVKPGNHVQKLKPETVEELNGRLSEVMSQFGYSTK